MASLPTTDTVDRPQQWGYDAILSTLLLRLAKSPERQLQIVTAPADAQRIQTEQTAEDYLPEFGDVFSRNNFTGGAGLDFAHRTGGDERDVTRYWESTGIDIGVADPGALDGVSLLPSTELVRASADTNLHTVRLPDGTVLFSSGNSVGVIDAPTSPGASVVFENPHTGFEPIADLTANGAKVFAACGADGTAVRIDGVWADLGTDPTFGLWAVKGRLLADNGTGLLVEVDPDTGVHTTLVTLGGSETIEDVIDAGSAILAATSTGVIYVLVDNAGTLALDNQLKLTSTDIPQCMAAISGVIIVGTADGDTGRLWRLVLAEHENSLGEAQLLRELPYVPRVAVTARDRIYVAARDSATTVALWRYQLATAGLARDLIFDAPSGEPVGLVRTSGLIYATVGGVGVFRQETTYVASGELVSPMADHFSPVRKTWVGLTVQAEGIGGGASIDLYVATKPSALLDLDGGDWFLVGRLTDPSQVASELVLPAITGRYGAVKAVLNASADRTISPRLISFALRSYSDSEDVIVQLPVNVSDWIERPNRRPFRVQGWGRQVLDALFGFDGKYVTMQLFRPPLVIKGIVESVQVPVSSRGVRGSATIFALVQVRGRIVGEGTSSGGNGPLGVTLLGVTMQVVPGPGISDADPGGPVPGGSVGTLGTTILGVEPLLGD